MWKVLRILVLTVCATICLSGFKPQDTIEIVYETEVYAEKGDCLETLIGPYYSKCNTKICWDEYKYNQKKLNEKLFKNGRALQVGDPVRIQWYVERKLEK